VKSNFSQYYINTREELSPDTRFAIEDAFALTRADLKLVEDLEESWNALQQALKENFHQTQTEKPADGEDVDEATLSDSADDDDERVNDEEAKSSAEEADVGFNLQPLRA
jgi:hypothetical protein